MASIQAHLMNAYLRIQHLVNPPSDKFDLEAERKGMDAFGKMFKPMVELEFTPIIINGVQAEWITPPQVVGNRTILYLHGGGYLFGSIRSHRNLAGNIANSAQARSLIIDYRLGPEHPYPEGLEDIISIYSWLLSQSTPPNQIFLVGDSAGGGLVLSALVALRDRGIPRPAAAVCMSPATDLTHSKESWKAASKNELVLGPNIIDQIKQFYLGDTDPHEPLASPIFADLHALPPLLIQVGSDEALLSDCKAFAECARAAGVDVTLEIWPKMQHVWQFTASFMPEGRQAIDRIGEFIRSK